MSQSQSSDTRYATAFVADASKLSVITSPCSTTGVEDGQDGIPAPPPPTPMTASFASGRTWTDEATQVKENLLEESARRKNMLVTQGDNDHNIDSDTDSDCEFFDAMSEIDSEANNLNEEIRTLVNVDRNDFDLALTNASDEDSYASEEDFWNTLLDELERIA